MCILDFFRLQMEVRVKKKKEGINLRRNKILSTRSTSSKSSKPSKLSNIGKIKHRKKCNKCRVQRKDRSLACMDPNCDDRTRIWDSNISTNSSVKTQSTLFTDEACSSCHAASKCKHQKGTASSDVQQDMKVEEADGDPGRGGEAQRQEQAEEKCLYALGASDQAGKDHHVKGHDGIARPRQVRQTQRPSLAASGRRDAWNRPYPGRGAGPPLRGCKGLPGMRQTPGGDFAGFQCQRPDGQRGDPCLPGRTGGSSGGSSVPGRHGWRATRPESQRRNGSRPRSGADGLSQLSQVDDNRTGR
ncbi:uncharacterized protein [Macrobrachium rosenbergii]|uniref:uncharacterized protein n=1 Tax=Macrobrachium rosenbergii TaxID=79674 RepID=UPI0034D4900C